MARLSNKIKNKGIEHYGFTPLVKPLSLDIYKNWLSQDLHADMGYLKDHLPLKENPDQLMPTAKSAIVLAVDYIPHPQPNPKPIKSLKVARYAQGEDYHFWLKRFMQELIEDFKSEYPKETFECFTDSSPIMERDLAHQAGLGWFGKNSMLIHPKRGSYFFICEIYTSLALDSATLLHPDRCGTCRRCIDACPTDAIIEGRQLDAKKCISYLTIEAKSVPPEELRHQIGDWFFGCDICQQVCPWNEKVFGLSKAPAQHPSKEDLIKELKFIFSNSNNELIKLFSKTPLTRARGTGLKRNAIIVAANLKLTELTDDISAFKTHPKLSELASWALSKLTCQEQP